MTDGAHTRERTGSASSRTWRWRAALVLAFAAVGLAIASVYVGNAQVCKNAIAGVRTVHVCSPPSVAQLALLFVPAVMLLLPDLSEVSVAGLSFKRDLDKVETTVIASGEALGRTVSKLTGDVSDIKRTSDRDTDTLIDVVRALRSLEERVARLESPRDASGEPVDGGLD
jgi:hypothetical protein